MPRAARKFIAWLWAAVWLVCMLSLFPFVLLARFFPPAGWLLWPLAPLGWIAGYAYKRTFDE